MASFDPITEGDIATNPLVSELARKLIPPGEVLAMQAQMIITNDRADVNQSDRLNADTVDKPVQGMDVSEAHLCTFSPTAVGTDQSRGRGEVMDRA